jgi:hypothetical protein
MIYSNTLATTLLHSSSSNTLYTTIFPNQSNYCAYPRRWRGSVFPQSTQCPDMHDAQFPSPAKQTLNTIIGNEVFYARRCIDATDGLASEHCLCFHTQKARTNTTQGSRVMGDDAAMPQPCTTVALHAYALESSKVSWCCGVKMAMALALLMLGCGANRRA